MEIEHTSEEELLVRFHRNPGTAATQEWVARIDGELTGREKLARVDLTELEILASLGVNVIVGLYQKMQKQGGTVLVEVASERTRRVFELFQLTNLFEVRVVAPQ